MTVYPNVANGQSEHTTGIITLDKTKYTIGEAMHITIVDPDNVYVPWSPEYCPIRIILTSNPSGVCRGHEYDANGSLVTNVSFGTAVQIAYYPQDYVKAKHGDVITVIYYDAISENGQPAEVTATARFEVTPLEAFPSSGLQHTITFSFDGPNGHETYDAWFRQSNGKIQGMQLYELKNGNIDVNGNITIESICPNDSRYSSTWTGVLNSEGTGSGTYQCSNGVGGTWNAISAENKAPNIPAQYQWDAFVSVTCIDCNKEMFYGNTMTIRAHAKDPVIVYKHVLVTITDPYGNIAMTKEMVIPKSGEVEEKINVTPEIFKYPGFYIVKGKLLLPYPRIFGTDECNPCASFKISEKSIPQTSPQTLTPSPPSIPEYTPPQTPTPESNYLSNGCPVDYPYEWSDGYCYDQPESNYLSNGCPVDYPYEWSDGYCYDQPESNYLSNGCPVGYPYLHSDGQCWNVSEELQPTKTKSLLYQNNQYGFSIKYPSNWQKNEILEIDEDKPNRMTIVTFTSPSQTALYMVGFAKNDPTYEGLNNQQILDKIKKETVNECQECQDIKFVSSETITHTNGYKMYYTALTTTMATDEGTLNPLIGYGFIPDGDDIWLIASVFFSQDDFEQILEEATSMGESFTIFDYEGEQIAKKVPEWFKGTTKWWADGQVDDQTFLNGVGFMIKEDIIHMPVIPEQAVSITKEKIPDWVRTNAKWWADGMISEDEFVNGIEYLVKNGIILAN